MVDTDQLKQFISSDFHKGLIGRAIAGLPKTVFQKCPTLVSQGSQITIVRPVSFAASGLPNAGVRLPSGRLWERHDV